VWSQTHTLLCATGRVARPNASRSARTVINKQVLQKKEDAWMAIGEW